MPQDLEEDAAHYWGTLLAAADAGLCEVAVQIDGHGAAARWFAGAAAEPTATPLGVTDMADGETLEDFLQWAASRVSAPRLVLIVFGHGSGLATLSPDQSGIAADGGSGRTLGLVELAEAVERALPAPLELVSLEACYAGSLEAAWALQDSARIMVGSPDLVYRPGLPWKIALAQLGRVSDGAGLGRALCETHDGPLVCLDLSRMQAVAISLGHLSSALLDDIELHSAGLRLTRSRVRSWGYRDELCDAAQLAGRLVAEAASERAAEAAAALAVQLDGLAISRSQCLVASSAGGMGLFFPSAWEPVPAAYAEQYSLARVSSWAELLDRHYNVSGRGLIR